MMKFYNLDAPQPLPGDHDYMGASWSEGLNRAGSSVSRSGWDSYLADMYKKGKPTKNKMDDVKNWERYLADIYKNRRQPARATSPPPRKTPPPRPRSLSPHPSPKQEVKVVPKIRKRKFSIISLIL